MDALPPGSSEALVKAGMRIGARRSWPRVTLSAQSNRPAPGTLLPGAGWRNSEPLIGGWRKTQFGQGVMPGNCREGKGERHSLPNSHAVSQRAVGNRVAMASVRSFVLKRPERVESAAWLLPSSSYAAVVKGRSELVINSNPCMRGQRSESTAPPMG